MTIIRKTNHRLNRREMNEKTEEYFARIGYYLTGKRKKKK